jgi:hypothetical protein
LPVKILLFLPLLLVLGLPARAQDIPRCTPEITGALACMAGRSCECGFRRGGLVSGEPDGWRWDCGVLRGGCDRPGSQVPADWYELPPGLTLDNSDNSIRLDQTTGVNTNQGGQQNIGPPDRPPSDGRPRDLFPGRGRAGDGFSQPPDASSDW